MASGQHILFAGDDDWRVAHHDGSATRWTSIPATEKTVHGQAAALHRTLMDSHYAGQPVLIALSASRCLATTLNTGDLPRNDAKARLYRLEAQLPIAAEQMVADYASPVRSGPEEQSLAVSADRAWLSQLVETLEANDIVVGPIVPAALLAAAAQTATDAAEQTLLFDEPCAATASLNLIELRSGRPLRWATLRPSLDEIQTQLEWQDLNAGKTAAIDSMGLDEELSRRLSTVNGWTVRRSSASSDELAVREGSQVLHGLRRPLIDLRTGPLAPRDRLRLYRRALNAALLAGVIVVLSITLSLGWRAMRYASMADRNQQQMMTLFHQTFPGWSTPGNFKAVIESEHRKLSGSGASGGQGSALNVLHDVLAHLPDSDEVTVQRMNFTPLRFELSGQLNHYESANSMAAAIRTTGLSVAPPQARRLADGRWSFNLQGSIGVAP